MQDLAANVYSIFLSRAQSQGILVAKLMAKSMMDFVEKNPLPVMSLFPLATYCPVGADSNLDRKAYGKANTLRDVLPEMFLFYNDDTVKVSIYAEGQSPIELIGLLSKLTITLPQLREKNIEVNDLVKVRWQLIEKGITRIEDETRGYLDASHDLIKLLTSREIQIRRLSKLTPERLLERMQMFPVSDPDDILEGIDFGTKDLIKLEAQVFALGKDIPNLEVDKYDYEDRRHSLNQMLVWVENNEENYK